MAKQDFYETLGVSKTADGEELKRAYRKLAMQFHPDRNAGDKGAEQRFKDVGEAYEVLKDDQKRAAYDRFGHAAFENGSRGPGDFAGGFSGVHGFSVDQDLTRSPPLPPPFLRSANASRPSRRPPSPPPPSRRGCLPNFFSNRSFPLGRSPPRALPSCGGGGAPSCGRTPSW